MRRFLPLALALNLLASATWGAVSVTNLGTGTSAATSVATQAVTTSADSPAGSLIIVHLMVAANLGGDTVTVTDNATGGSNTYSLATSCVAPTTTSERIYYSVAARDLPNGGTITANWTTTGRTAMSAAVATGPTWPASPLDVHPTCVTGSSVTTLTLASGTLAEADELLIGGLGTNGVISAYCSTPCTPFSTNLTAAGATTPVVSWSWFESASTASVNYVPTWTSARNAGAYVVSFKTTAVASVPVCTLATLGVGGC